MATMPQPLRRLAQRLDIFKGPSSGLWYAQDSSSGLNGREPIIGIGGTRRLALEDYRKQFRAQHPTLVF